MATASCLLCEDHFLCSICLDVFTDPVTLPCGHNFCKKCIEQHWNYDCTYTCPYCKQVFKSKPDVKVNGFISEMAAKFRQSQSNASAQSAAHVEPVYCNFCTDPRVKALKSCLVCMASYCESHLEPHLHMTKRHKLVEPQRIPDNMVEERLTQMPDTEIQEMIAMRRQKIQQLYRFMELNNKDANLEITKGVQAFTDLKISVEGELDIFFEDISKKKKTMEEKAKGYIGELEGEISELKKGTRITKDLSNFGIVRPTYQGTAARSMAQLDEKLGRKMNVAFLSELQRVQKERVNVVLDPNKVHPRSTNPSNTKSNDDGPACKCVLATQTFSSGTFYFEVDVKDKSRWALGLAKDLHTNREVALTPQNSYWVICMRNKNELYAGIEPSTRLSLKSKPEKVGVFLDYGEGLVSFYDANKAAMIYTFTGCDFPQKLHPFFSPCPNDGIHLHCTPDSSCVLQ